MNKYQIPNLRNACRLMELLGTKKEGLNIAELTRLLGVSRTSVLRIASTLADEGFLEENDRKFRLGYSLIRLGSRALENSDIRTLAHPVLEELAVQTRETAHLAIMANDKSLILDVCDSPNPLRVASRPGTMVDLHCSSTGKVFLAFLFPNELESFYKGKTIKPYTANTKDSYERIKEDIAATCRQGYGLDDEEFSEGVRCLAAPIYNSFGHVVAAVGITGSTSRFTKVKIKEMAGSVMNAANQISKKLGS